MPNYTFRCRLGHESDAIRPVGTQFKQCHVCGRKAYKRTVYRQAQVEPQRKVYARDFLEASDQIASQLDDYERREGAPAPSLPLAQMGKRRAQELIAKGAPDSRSIW